MHILDRPLLLGLVALERDLISPAELVQAFRTWRLRPESSFGHLLVERAHLSDDCISSLEKLLADSFQAEKRNSEEPKSRAVKMSWQQDTASFAIKGEATKSLDSSNQSTDYSCSAESDDAGFAALRYRRIRLHAMGGLGQVFVADDLELRRQVALKEIRDSAADDAGSRRRFIAEAEITGKLEHPGIVPVYGLGVYPDGRPFYAMRFIEGETLAAAIKSFHQEAGCDFSGIAFRQLLSRVVSVCNAVGFAHSRAIVHRDLKPQNVMLGPFGETLVVDWGLAKLLKAAAAAETGNTRYIRLDLAAGDADDATSMGEIVGTPAYMSPEQAAGRVNEIGPASDVYGLGAILYALLTGQAPLTGGIAEIRATFAQRQIPHPRQVKPRAPRALAAICLKAMAAEPADRYASALKLAADIDRWLAGEATVVYREPWTDTAFRWIRKHRLPVAVAMAVLVATSVALGAGFFVVRNERDIAQSERQKAVAANKLAQENAKAARDVVDEFLLKIGDDQRARFPGLESLRLEMVKLAVDRYRAILRQQPNDPALIADAAVAFRRCANLYRMVGQYTPANQLYNEAVSRLRAVATENSDNPIFGQRLCETLVDRALAILRTSGPKKAEPALREALSVGQRLYQAHPDSVPAIFAVARAEMNLAEVLREQEHHGEALRLAEAAVASMQRVAKERPNDLSVQLSVVLSNLNRAEMMRENGAPSEAAAILQTTAQRLQGYLTARPDEPNLRFLLASSRVEHALLASARGDFPNEVRSIFEEAVNDLERQVIEFPRTASRRRKLAETLTAFARFEVSMKNDLAAVAAASRAIQLLEELDREEDSPAAFQHLLGSAYLVAGEAELARNDLSAAKAHLREAQHHIQQASDVNPDSQRLRDEIGRIRTLLASVEC